MEKTEMTGICSRLALPDLTTRPKCAQPKTQFKAEVRPSAVNAKPEPRKKTKARAERTEAQIKTAVRAEVVERDAGCRFSWLSPCEGLLEWAHLFSRSKSRGMAPVVRHTSAGSCMACSKHHRELDAHEFRIIFETDKGADGPFHVALPGEAIA